MESLKYSIVIPVYNVENQIENCIKSIVKQNYSNYEIIMVDDGSTDGSGKKCDELSYLNNNIKVIHQVNKGVSEARNIGLSESQGNYILFFDPDDYISGELFLELDKNLQSKCDLLIFGYWDELNDGIKIPMRFDRDLMLNKNQFQKKFIELFETSMLYTVWNKVYRKSFLIENKIKFEKFSFGEDTRFNLKVYSAITECQLISKSFYHYTIGRTDSATTIYRNDRYLLKLEEVYLIKDLIDEWSSDLEKEQKFFLKQLGYIFVDTTNHIADSNLKIQEKISNINNIMNFKEFNILLQNKKNKNINIRLLSKKKYRLFFLYRVLVNYIKKITVFRSFIINYKRNLQTKLID